jgi:hypothetical protein
VNSMEPSAVGAGCRLEYVGPGPGVPRKGRRAFAPRLRPAVRPHPDVHAIASVSR